MAKKSTKELSDKQSSELYEILRNRFEKNMNRHKGLKWDDVAARLQKSPAKLWSLQIMEETGGEPDVVGFDKKSGEFIFMDCSPESPKGRRSVCYDHEALESRKEHKPKDSALGMAESMGAAILDEEKYRQLQSLGTFDAKTSSWLKTPDSIRERGGAIFGDWRYGQVFIYHNGAESYYAARGFRCELRV
jgi:hypothetical protein